jgi:YydF family exported signaling peptide
MEKTADDVKTSILDEFMLDRDEAELAVVDDLWYFITNGQGAWIVGG